MEPLTEDQKDKISLVLESIFDRPELLRYMREQLKNKFWEEIKEWENNDGATSQD